MDLALYAQFVLALVVVLALIGLLAVGARRLGFGPRLATGRGRKRLSIVEVMPIDPKRRLVLVRRDATEHLLLLGTHDLVIEAGIPAPTDAPAPAAFASAPAPFSTSETR